ncbi:MAG: mechanosensitive ion channel family protein [Muribaculaceae bacterium]|nr:mechanosensitive ion channel family protein [Muribaculaceae bacterium]
MKKTSTLNRLLLFLIVLVISTTQAHAVFKERDFGKTIDVLCAELEMKYKQQQQTIKSMEQRALMQHEQLVATMQQIDQISLILYSQSSEFTFAMAYACQQATDLYHNSKITHLPFDKIMTRLDAEVERYDSLITVLKRISPAIENVDNNAITEVADSIMQSQQAEVIGQPHNPNAVNDPRLEVENMALYVLNDKEIEIREKCLFYAEALRDNTIKIKEKMSADKRYYDEVSEKLNALNNYALKKYEELQNNIFRNGGSNYFQVLASVGNDYNKINDELKEKYQELNRDGEKANIKSQWRGPVILMTSVFVLFYIFIATLLSAIILRWCLPKKIRNNSDYKRRRTIIGLTCGVFLFSVFISIANSLMHHNFIVMAIGITLDYSWLLFVILLSLLIRLTSKQINAGVMVYTPFLLMAFVVIVFRIILVPNNVVNLLFPPLMLVFTIWQFIVVKKLHVEIPTIDVVFSTISLITMIVSCVLAWVGYTLLAVQIMVWWSFQLACLQTIVCLYDLAKMINEKYIVKRIKKEEAPKLKGKNKKTSETKLFNKILSLEKKGDYINHTWVYDLFIKVVLPVMAVLSVLMSIIFAVNMFDMKQLLVKIFFHNFIDQEGVIQISLYKIVLVGALFFVFYYINYLAHSIYRRYKLKQFAKTDTSRRPNITLGNNIITILVWGSFFIFALVLFKVPKSGISLISAGLATGLGFAMKDILENFIYGLSLMSGRLRVGDYIECDGILGRVESIGYQSTQIVTLDGSIIAFLNASLFNKNFKNFTKNHSYEYVKLPIGVAYGVKVNEVRDILESELNRLNDTTSASGRQVVQKKQGFKVFFGGFGESSVDLIVAFWVLVEEKINFVYKVKETIYNTLQNNSIEIPFPQRDVYIKQVAKPTTGNQKEKHSK